MAHRAARLPDLLSAIITLSYVKLMASSYPFALAVRPARHLPERFNYSIGQPGKLKVHALHTFSSFDEAREVGKAALDQMIAQWRERETEAAGPSIW
ncbi:hypothetical protein [Methylobacterium iners]|uniref:Uncharacterized protein n=1 Tax=Methylobacterium iners TaxID=418707 RepID=A0ABQ4S3Q5_9HYPH|nr:hypothetical protein [Methylobacterium iners]GJD97761.1 hypothetical protein OCOJLMKI_4994 [Methylobacterium iners]